MSLEFANVVKVRNWSTNINWINSLNYSEVLNIVTWYDCFLEILFSNRIWSVKFDNSYVLWCWWINGKEQIVLVSVSRKIAFYLEVYIM